MKLNKKYSPEELAESFVFRQELTPAERESAARDLAAARARNRESMSDDDIQHAKLLQLRLQLEDYLQLSRDFDEERGFGYFLRKYIKLGYKTLKRFAFDIQVDETELSQVLNGHRKPNDKLLFRIEAHSKGLLSALLLNRLLEREREYHLLSNSLLREEQVKYVRRTMFDAPTDPPKD